MTRGAFLEKPAKPFLVIFILKAERCIGLKFCMKGTSVYIKNVMELKSSVIIRFEILLWFSRCKKFSGPLRNWPLLKVMHRGFSQSLNLSRTYCHVLFQETDLTTLFGTKVMIIFTNLLKLWIKK